MLASLRTPLPAVHQSQTTPQADSQAAREPSTPTAPTHLQVDGHQGCVPVVGDEQQVGIPIGGAPAGHVAGRLQGCLAEQGAAEEAAAAEAASAPAEQAEAAVEQLQEQLAAKLQLHEEEGEQQQLALAVAAEAAETAEAAAPEEEEEAEELTPLQQLLLLCGQEVRPAAAFRGQCSSSCCCANICGQPKCWQ